MLALVAHHCLGGAIVFGPIPWHGRERSRRHPVRPDVGTGRKDVRSLRPVETELGDRVHHRVALALRIDLLQQQRRGNLELAETQAATSQPFDRDVAYRREPRRAKAASRVGHRACSLRQEHRPGWIALGVRHRELGTGPTAVPEHVRRSRVSAGQGVQEGIGGHDIRRRCPRVATGTRPWLVTHGSHSLPPKHGRQGSPHGRRGTTGGRQVSCGPGENGGSGDTLGEARRCLFGDA